MKERLLELINVKSLITITLTVVFAAMTLQGCVENEEFISIFKMIIVFYFGTQVGKRESTK